MFSFTPLLSLLASSTLLVQGLPVIDNTASISRRDSETTTPPLSRRGSAVETTIFDDDFSLESRAVCEAEDDPIRGVNLGGWLVMEPWMNWELVGNTGAVDQWSFDQTANAESALQSHWQSWFGEADMAKIASWGLNTYVLFSYPPKTRFDASPPRHRYTTRPLTPHTSTLFSLIPALILTLYDVHSLTTLKQRAHPYWILGLQQHRQPIHLRRRCISRTSPWLGPSIQHSSIDLHARPPWVSKRLRQLWPQRKCPMGKQPR
jgi:hypothetical protein